MELKRQLFEGFDALIDQKLSPLKTDIQELKNERKLECSELNAEMLTRKIKQSDAKHKKLENRLSQIEDQLLEKQSLFQPSGFPGGLLPGITPLPLLLPLYPLPAEL